MAKKTTTPRAWTREDLRLMTALAREKVKTNVIARKATDGVGQLLCGECVMKVLGDG